MNKKTCITCLIEKEENVVYFELRKDTCRYRNECRICSAKKHRFYQIEHKEEISIKQKIFRQEHKEEIAKTKKIHYEANKKDIIAKVKVHYEENKEAILEQKKEYYDENKEAILETHRKYQQKQRKNNPVFRIRGLVSCQIRQGLKARGLHKNWQQAWTNLPYTPQQLADHLEALFNHPDNLTADGKVWMNWNNQGVYRSKSWDNNNPNTWKWNIDHIKPHSMFEYQASEGKIFLDCWALSNLRPYSAKQNVIDGNSRTQNQIK